MLVQSRWDAIGCQLSLVGSAVSDNHLCSPLERQEKLMAQAPPTRVHGQAETDELALLQVAEESDESEEEGAAEGLTPKKNKKQGLRKTRTDRNREARKRAARLAVLKVKNKKAWNKKFANLAGIVKEVDMDAQEAEERLKARRARQAELRTKVPPQIGSGKWEPLPVQVLTTSDATGSLREIKPMAMLVQERYADWRVMRGVQHLHACILGNVS